MDGSSRRANMGTKAQNTVSLLQIACTVGHSCHRLSPWELIWLSPGGFSAFTGGSLPLSGVSPKEVNVPGIGNVGVHGHPMKGGESPPTDMATKQYVFLLDV